MEVVDYGTKRVVAKEPIVKQRYICEYKTYRVYAVDSAEERKLAEMYEKNKEGSYVLYTQYVVPEFEAQLCFDATKKEQRCWKAYQPCTRPWKCLQCKTGKAYVCTGDV